MNLRLVAIEATCRNELAAGDSVPSEHLRVLAATAGLRSETLAALRAEAQRKFETALAGAFA